jgi:hypothetical protein
MLVRGLREAEAHLARLNFVNAAADALTAAAQELKAKVVADLSQPPGQDHGAPWLRTGMLRASIGHDIDGIVAVVGSSSDVAVDQELGTRTDPPRPFLASTAAGSAADLVVWIAATLERHLADQ